MVKDIDNVVYRFNRYEEVSLEVVKELVDVLGHLWEEEEGWGIIVGRCRSRNLRRKGLSAL